MDPTQLATVSPVDVGSNASAVFAVVYALNKFGVIDKIPAKYHWLVPVLTGAADAIINALLLHKSLSEAAQIGFGALVSAVGVHKTLKDSPLPYGGDAT